jgi:hypothetical protein
VTRPGRTGAEIVERDDAAMVTIHEMGDGFERAKAKPWPQTPVWIGYRGTVERAGPSTMTISERIAADRAYREANPPPPPKPVKVRRKRVGKPPTEKPAPEQVRTNKHGGRVPPSGKIERWVLHRDSYQCQRCGMRSEDASGLHLHHIVEVCRGGIHDPDNLETLCEDCHIWWTACAPGGVSYEDWKKLPSGGIFEFLAARALGDAPEHEPMRADLRNMTALDLMALLAGHQEGRKGKRSP